MARKENTMKAIERATNNEYRVEKLEGGYEVYTLSGEKYKKLKESTFKRNFKLVEGESDEDFDTVQPEEPKQAKKVEKPIAHEELSPEKREKMIEKIKKMMNLAEHNPSVEEGLAAALQAQKLMAKYNIHQEEVAWEEVEDDIESTIIDAIERRVLMAWRTQLALIIGKNFRCKVYKLGKAVAFRGYKQDTKIAAEVYKSLYIIGDKLAMKEQARIQKATGSGKGMYNSYIVGFLKGIEEGFGEQCTALMIVVPKEVEEEFKEFSKDFNTKSTKSLGIVNKEAYDKGRTDGKFAVKSRGVEQKGGKR